jgi:hypothetical protein
MHNWFAPLFLMICIANPRPSFVCAQSAAHIMVTPVSHLGA